MLGICMALIDDEDKDSFEKIYYKYKMYFFSLSMKKLHNPTLAEEAVSETFLELAKSYQKIHNLKLSEIIAYTVIINRNLCYDILKKEKRQTDIAAESAFSEQDICDFEKEIKSVRNSEIIHRIPELFRDVVMLKYYYGFSIKDISKMLDISVGGVKYRLSAARKALKKELEDYE